MERELEPLGLVLKVGTWYLVARSGRVIRTYKVANVLGLRLLDDRFAYPADFDLATHWQKEVERASSRACIGPRPRSASLLTRCRCWTASVRPSPCSPRPSTLPAGDRRRCRSKASRAPRDCCRASPIRSKSWRRPSCDARSASPPGAPSPSTAARSSAVELEPEIVEATAAAAGHGHGARAALPLDPAGILEAIERRGPERPTRCSMPPSAVRGWGAVLRRRCISAHDLKVTSLACYN